MAVIPSARDPIRLWASEFDLTQQEFHALRDLVYAQTGIALGPQKREMLRARLTRRLRALGLRTFADYFRLLRHESAGEEMTRFINAMTTNVTSFFREPHHFEYLGQQWVPRMRDRALREGRRRIRIWCAGCSTGEEAYSIVAVVRDALGPAAPVWDVRLLASDIDTDALERATAGVYHEERTTAMPPDLRARLFLRGRGEQAGLVRVRPESQAMITFRHLNLMDPNWPIRTTFDAIFCRNVLIYFDRPTQRRIIDRLRSFLEDDGLLFLGHSESLHGMSAGMQHVANTIYQRRPARATGEPAADCSLSRRGNI